jgi:DNA-directed RNA polymerase subunit RPC12/RpoP
MPDEVAALDPDVDLVVDGNAVAGLLEEAFAAEVTGLAGTCAHCGTRNLVGAMRAWTRGPGVVLRCPACNGVVIRMARTPHGLQVDVQASLPLAPVS